VITETNFLEVTPYTKICTDEEKKKKLGGGGGGQDIHVTFINLCILSSCSLSKNTTHNTVTLPVAVCGCETWSLTLREGYMLWEFKNRVLINIFGYKKIEQTEEWQKINTDKLHDLHSALYIYTVIKMRKFMICAHS
jgi:hypothetical protein